VVTVLVIDDEEQIRHMLRHMLEPSGFTVIDAATGKEGIVRAMENKPDVILLDLGLPDQSGHTVLKHLRQWFHSVIIILSVLDNEEDIVSALHHGADDYVRKPFGVKELLARIQVCLQHYAAKPVQTVATFQHLTIDFAKQRVWINDAPIRLTSTEYALLHFFILNAGKVLTHRVILQNIWGPAVTDDVQYLRVYVQHLRQKIEHDPHKPTLLFTEPGIGYRFS